MKFDVIIANPPYNQGRKILWANFALKSLKTAKSFMAMIHPCRWRGPGQTSPQNIGTLRDEMKKHDLIWLDIHNMRSAQKHFKAGTRFDCYIVRKTCTDVKTQIKGEDGVEFEMECKNREFIPNAQSDILDRIIDV